ncbi:MAG: beta-ketoacyl-[acyl-carrier-protein] synthase family protein [Gemmatimonadaceae bacterium]|nr:beta-ketoacyl-[acyl-carrier-protein] synthase family protein [Gemmatimonadaceae bacterium]
MTRRVVLTGMSVNTPLGDTLAGFSDALYAGRSAITRWRAFPTDRIYSKVGGDLSAYDVTARVEALRTQVPDDVHRRLRRLVGRVPWSTGLSCLLAVDGYLDAGLFDAPVDRMRVAAIVAGHNINGLYQYDSRLRFEDEPDFLDGMTSLYSLDTDHAGSVSEVLQVGGPIYTMGAACASGNVALRSAVDEIRHHGMQAAIVVGAVLEFAPIDVHAMALMGAISHESFNETPSLASRPYDTRREGFVPSHGGATLVLEEHDAARARGARIYAEVLAVGANADGNHLPQPSEDGQARLMRDVLHQAGVHPAEVGYINAHATSTPLGDLTELRSIKRVFGAHARSLHINAPKSMLGHTCWAAPTVETVAAILQLRSRRLHRSINIDTLDPEVDLDVCRDGNVAVDTPLCLKNSFGFGGINSVALWRRYDA